VIAAALVGRKVTLTDAACTVYIDLYFVLLHVNLIFAC
jgi:hypothetical protein